MSCRERKNGGDRDDEAEDENGRCSWQHEHRSFGVENPVDFRLGVRVFLQQVEQNDVTEGMGQAERLIRHRLWLVGIVSEADVGETQRVGASVLGVGGQWPDVQSFGIQCASYFQVKNSL